MVQLCDDGHRGASMAQGTMRIVRRTRLRFLDPNRGQFYRRFLLQ